MLPLLAGCGGVFQNERPSSSVSAIWRENIVVTIEGRLLGPPSTPGRCRLLYPRVGDPFALIGSTQPFDSGSFVRVSGPVSTWSDCGTYRTVRVDRISQAK